MQADFSVLNFMNGFITEIDNVNNVNNAQEREDQWIAIHVRLIDSFVALKSPFITADMLPLLNNIQIVRLFVAYLTRRPTCGSFHRDTNVRVVSTELSESIDAESNVIDFKWQRIENSAYDVSENPENDEIDNISSRFNHWSLKLHNVATQNGIVDDTDSEALRRSFKVMSLLCVIYPDPTAPNQCDENSQPLNACFNFIRKFCPALFAYLLDAFHPKSSASLYHVCRVLDYLLNYHANILIQSLTSNSRKTFKIVVATLLDYLHCPCVGEIIQTLICPIPRNATEKDRGYYTLSPSVRKQYFKVLANINVLSLIADHIWLHGTPDVHKVAAAELFTQMVEKYSGIEGCSDILASMVHSVDPLQHLVEVVCVVEKGSNESTVSSKFCDENEFNSVASKVKANRNVSKNGKTKKGSQSKVTNKSKGRNGKNRGKDLITNSPTHSMHSVDNSDGQIIHSPQREAALGTLLTITELAKKPYVVSVEPHGYTGFVENANNMVPCQIVPVSERFFSRLESNLKQLCNAMAKNYILPPSSINSETINSSQKGRDYVGKSFSNYRLELIKLVVSCVARRPKELLQVIPIYHWKLLTTWFIEYPNCNLYHVPFRSLMDELIKCSETTSQTSKIISLVLIDCGLLRHMIEIVSLGSKSKSNASGHALLICCVIRLHSQSLSPESTLRKLLTQSEQWQEFLPLLELEMFKITDTWRASDGKNFEMKEEDNCIARKNQETTISKIIQPSKADVGIDLGSGFANSIGFEGVTEYNPLHNTYSVRSKCRKSSKSR